MTGIKLGSTGGADCFDHGIRIRELAGLQFGIDFVAINGDLKSTAARWHQGERADELFEFQNFFRQTDGMGLVISSRAIFNFHVQCHSRGTLSRCLNKVKRLDDRPVALCES